MSNNNITKRPLVDKQGNIIVPITHIEAVYDSEGNTLPEYLNSIYVSDSKPAAENGTDLSLVTTGEKYIWNSKYAKPSTGIPSTDLASGVLTSLDKANVAIPNTEKGQALGVATLDSNALLNEQQLPESVTEEAAITYGTCSSEANVQNKVVTISNTHWKLKVGSIVDVLFINTNTVISEENYEITLNVNNTGAKQIYYGDSASPEGILPEVYGTADKHIQYMYNGTYWVWQGFGNIIDTKNTAGSTNSALKLYIVGASEQSANPQTYSHTNVYIGTDHCLYSNDSKVLVAADISGKADTSDLTALENAIKYNDVLGTTISSAERTAWNAKVDSSSVGVANGIAQLDANGKVPSSQLPAYVDDVIEAYYYGVEDPETHEIVYNMYSDSQHTIIITPESSIIYIDLSTNKEYRWGGSTYVEISQSLAIGTTSGTACEGNDPRLSDSRPASDVYAWAKAATKPTYTSDEVGMMYSVVSTDENKANQVAPEGVTGVDNSGKCAHVIYNNTGNDDYTISISTSSGYVTPNGAALELICPNGGYSEVSYLNINGTIFVRGL